MLYNEVVCDLMITFCEKGDFQRLWMSNSYQWTCHMPWRKAF